MCLEGGTKLQLPKIEFSAAEKKGDAVVLGWFQEESETKSSAGEGKKGGSRLHYIGKRSKEVDALVLVTEWKPFCYPDLALMKKWMRRPIILDGRNQYDPAQLREAGFEYYGVGR